MPNRLSVIIIGAAHVEFTLFSVLNRIYKKLCEQNIPCSYMQEGPSDATLATEIEATLRGLDQDKILKQMAPEIKAFYVKEEISSCTYLPQSAWDPIEKIVKHKFMPLLGPKFQNQGVITHVVHDLYRENAYKEEIKFYENLQQLGVHFAGLDAATSTYNEQMITSSSSAVGYYNNELVRIRAMVTNFFQTITERFSKGGVVFVSVGD